MSFNTDTFLPPVLAVGAGQRNNGRQQLGSGLVTHKGVIDVNCLRATGALYPQHGAGLEVVYNQASVPKRGVIQSYDRDAATYTDLNIVAANVNLIASGGKVTLPAGTAQVSNGVRWIGTWNIPAATAWYETPSQYTASVTAGNVVRVEASGTLLMSTAGVTVYVGLGMDGAIVYDSMQAFGVMTAGPTVGYSVVGYFGSQITTTGNHRFAVFLYMNGANGGGFWNGAFQYIYVTEQRA